MTQQHKDPPPVPGVHLVKTTSLEEDSLASDVVDILQDGLRGGADCDVGGVEETYRTTLELDEAKRTEHEFMQALARRLKERCHWADGKRGLEVSELNRVDSAPGWRFGLYDREGRHLEVDLTFSEIFEVAQVQKKSTLNGFHRTLDRVGDKFLEARAMWFKRMGAPELN